MTTERPPTTYRRIARQLAESIRSGQLQPGARVPTIDQIANDFDASRSTAQRAVILLRANGYIVPAGAGRRIDGYCVADPGPMS